MTFAMHALQSHAAMLFLGSMAFTCAPRAAEPRPTGLGRLCAHSDIRVIAAHASDLRDGCFGARAALAFLAPNASGQIRSMVIDVREKLPESAGATAVGAYMKHCSCPMFVSYAAFRAQKTWFKVPVSRALYRSLATHEAAHAVAAHLFQIPNPTIHAKEYVAYVTMFATMEAQLRGRSLSALPGDGFASEARISLIFYMFDPMLFGAEAYRHYMKPENGATFLQLVLAGKVLTTE